MFKETLYVDKWGYLIGICILFILWGLFYFTRPDLRLRILVMSIILVPLAPVGQYYFLKDYWHPPLILPIQIGSLVFGGLTDLLFAFAIGGIATAAFSVLFRQITFTGNARPRHWIGFAFLAIEGVCVIVSTQFLYINSIFSSSLGFVLTAVLMIVIRRDLFKSLVVSGLISGLALAGAEGILSFVTPLYLTRYWYLYHTEYGMLIFNRVPATELMWGIAFGMVMGPIFDFYKGQTFTAKTGSRIVVVNKSVYGDIPKEKIEKV
ncbi:MAG TPA: hypothetical protein VEP90_08030 [Methylomirabilota bacterium]|nr:hypothetical protein [Methylomirabilota bacterium]